MVEVSFPSADKCSFTFNGLSEVLPEKYQPLSKEGSELAFFLDLLAKNNMLTNQRSTEGEMFSGWSHYGCRFGKIPFTLDYDRYRDWVHFSAETPENARQVAQRLKTLIEAEAAKKRK